MVYKRLHTLQARLTQQLPHTAGLNPKLYRWDRREMFMG